MSETQALTKEEQRTKLEQEYKSPYRFVAIFAIGIVHLVLMGTTNQPAALSAQIIGELGADVPLFAQICTVGFLTGAIFSIPMGILADKWNVPGTIAVGLIVCFIGAVWRSFCTDPITLYASCFIMGFGLAGLNANSAKYLKAWFGFRRVSTAMGAYVGFSGIGVSVCMAAIGFFPENTMHDVFVFDAILVAIAVVVWLAFGRMPKSIAADTDNFSAASVKACLTNKHLMITSLAMVLIMCVTVAYAAQSVAGYIYIGADPVTAANWSALIGLFGIPCNFIWPWIADKIGSIKKVFVPISIISVILFTVAWLTGNTPYFVPLVCTAYLFGFGGAAFIKGCVGKIPSIKREHMGTAGGIQTFFQNLGAYIIPSFILAPLCGGNYVIMFIMVSVIFALGIIVVAFMMPEFGAKGKLAQENKDKLDW